MSLAVVAAEEEIKYPSLDGLFALRITKSKNDEYHPMVELIEKQSGTVFVPLHSGSGGHRSVRRLPRAPRVWSADSKRVAYGFRANPLGARLVERGALVCFWNGSGFDKVFLLENLPSPRIKFP